MANRLHTVSVPVETLDKKNAYIKELETRLRLATSPERAKQMRDHITAMVAAIELILAKACRGTRAMQITQQLCVPKECLDAARKAMKEPAIQTVIGEGPQENDRPLRGFIGENPTSTDMQKLARKS